MEKEEIKQGFDKMDLFMDRFHKSTVKAIKIFGAIVIAFLTVYWGVERELSQREDERTYKFREEFLSNYKQAITRVDNLEQKASSLSETKLDTIEYIKKNIVDEYPKVLRNDFDSINSVAISQIQDALDKGLFKNKEDLLFFNSANYIVSKYREYELFQRGKQ